MSENLNDYLNRISGDDQVQSAMRSLAFVVWSYYRSLTELGFPHDCAMELTVEYQAEMIRRA